MEMWLSKEKPWLRNVLPGRLGGRINRWLYTPLLEATYIFRGCSRKFISQLVRRSQVTGPDGLYSSAVISIAHYP